MIFQLEGVVVPKARPRLSPNGAYLPKRYRVWKNGAIAYLKPRYPRSHPMQNVEISISFFGSHRGDLDNLAGAILDALVQSEIILDDRISVVKKLTVEHFESSTKKVIIDIQERL